MKDQIELSRLFKQARQNRQLSLRAVAKQVGVHFSTLQRLEHNNATCDFDVRVRVERWLGYDAIDEGVTITRTGDTLENIHNTILVDKFLSTENKTSLCHLMAICYQEFVKQSAR